MQLGSFAPCRACPGAPGPPRLRRHNRHQRPKLGSFARNTPRELGSFAPFRLLGRPRFTAHATKLGSFARNRGASNLGPFAPFPHHNLGSFAPYSDPSLGEPRVSAIQHLHHRIAKEHHRSAPRAPRTPIGVGRCGIVRRHEPNESTSTHSSQPSLADSSITPKSVMGQIQSSSCRPGLDLSAPILLHL